MTSDALTQYLNEIGQYRLLSAAEERTATVEQLVNHNLRLVVSIARRYMGRGLELMDLIAEGNLGLIKAAEKFDPERGNKFSTVATWWIEQAVSRALPNTARAIRLPVHMHERVRQLNRARAELTSTGGHLPTLADLAAQVGWSVERVRAVLSYARDTTSMDRELTTSAFSHRSTTLADFIPADVPPADARAIGAELAAHVRAVLAELSERERQIVIRRWLSDEDVITLSVVGEEMGMTRENVRLIERRAFTRLREQHGWMQEYLRDG